MAINNAQQVVQKTGNLNVPVAMRNASSALMKELGYGEKYKYSHDFDGNFVAQEYLPNEIAGTLFYNAGSSVKEQDIEKNQSRIWKNKYKK